MHSQYTYAYSLIVQKQNIDGAIEINFKIHSSTYVRFKETLVKMLELNNIHVGINEISIVNLSFLHEVANPITIN